MALNSDDDSVFGFEQAAGGEASGSRALLHSTAVPHERAPMLETAFERLAHGLKTSLRAFGSDNVEVTLTDITSTRFGPYLGGMALPALLAIVKTEPWGGSCLLTLSGELVYSLVESLLGGGSGAGTAGNGGSEGRGFTSIETRIADRLFTTILSNAEQAFATVTPVSFKLETYETSPRFAAIAPPGSLTALARFHIDTGAVIGGFEIAVPYSTFEPVRDVLLTSYSGDKLGNDEIWGTHLAAQAAVSQTTLSAVLYEGRMPLGRIMQLGVGETLMFTVKADDPVDIRCDNVTLARGRIGRVDHNIAVRVDNLQNMVTI